MYDRQQSYGGMYDRQQSYGGLNDDRQQSYGGMYDRQQSYGGLNDRQQSYGGMYDPEYINYKLKKTFDDVWGSGAATPPTAAPGGPRRQEVRGAH